MAVVLLIILAGSAVAGHALWRERRKSHRQDGGGPRGQASVEPTVPTFHIVSLGPQGPGGTHAYQLIQTWPITEISSPLGDEANEGQISISPGTPSRAISQAW